MTATISPWPVCPPPYGSESLHSWFERVGAAYGLSAHRLLSSIARGLPRRPGRQGAFNVGVELANNREIAQRLVALSGLPTCQLSNLRGTRTGWELRRREFRAYCPQCCLDDLNRGETPYGRRVWQQAWYTVCGIHQLPLLQRPVSSIAPSWSRHQLQQDVQFAADSGYRDLKGLPREPYTRFYIQYAILELQKATHNALAGIRPRRRQWGAINAKAFLHVLRDVTTWSLTHFEPVRSWSLAEELTPIEISETHQLLSRHRRMTSADYPADRSARSLVDIENPGLRSSALWFAHSVMASFHQDASDRPTAYRRTVRQDMHIVAISPAARSWLSTRMQAWPDRYRRICWANPTPEQPKSRFNGPKWTENPEILATK